MNRLFLANMVAFGALAGPSAAQTPPPTIEGEADVCLHRYVGNLSDHAEETSCPAGTADWEVVTLNFDPPETGIVPEQMNKYCAYDWAGTGNPDPTSLPGGQAWLSADCYAVGTAGEISQPIGEFVRDTFLRGVDRPDALPANPTKIALAVVDTSPTTWQSGAPGIGQFEHGRSVATAARRLSCYGGTCAADVLPVLGLPRTAPDVVDTDDGGHFGYQSELAEGIYEAVRIWKTQNYPRLVINLSVGWQARFGGSQNPATDKASVRMVWDAIRYARCHGALVFAAAGNKGYVAEYDSHALFPAAWVEQLEPKKATCTGIVPARANGLTDTPVDSLIVPVAGLNRHDEPLHNARPYTRTTIEAPGANVAVWDVQNSSLRSTLTGSSMATGAVSGAAAALWAYHPDNTPHGILELLHHHGVDLGVKADLCIAASCPHVRRLSFCQALNGICAMTGSTCAGYAATCKPTPQGDDYAPDVDIDDRNNPLLVADIDHNYSYPTNPPDPMVDLSALDAMRDLVGMRVHPWITPQPGPNSCDICLFIPDEFLQIRFDPKTNYLVENVVVTLFDDIGTKKIIGLTEVNPNLDVLTPGQVYQIDGVQHGLNEVKEALIEYTVNGNYYQDDIVIY